MEKIRAPRQKRGQDALESLLKAGSELLAEFGYDGFTMTELSRRSGVSNGAMYWRVENKDALLHAIHDRFIDETAAYTDVLANAAPWDGLPIADVVRNAVVEVGKVFSHNVPLMRALSLRAGTDPMIRATAAAALHRANAAFCSLLEPRLRAAGHLDPHNTPDMIFTAVTGAMAARVTWPEFHAAPLDWDRFVDSLCQMAVAQVEAGLPKQ